MVNKHQLIGWSLLARTSPPDQYIHGERTLLILESGGYAYV